MLFIMMLSQNCNCVVSILSDVDMRQLASLHSLMILSQDLIISELLLGHLSVFAPAWTHNFPGAGGKSPNLSNTPTLASIQIPVMFGLWNQSLAITNYIFLASKFYFIHKGLYLYQRNIHCKESNSFYSSPLHTFSA